MKISQYSHGGSPLVATANVNNHSHHSTNDPRGNNAGSLLLKKPPDYSQDKKAPDRDYQRRPGRLKDDRSIRSIIVKMDGDHGRTTVGIEGANKGFGGNPFDQKAYAGSIMDTTGDGGMMEIVPSVKKLYHSGNDGDDEDFYGGPTHRAILSMDGSGFTTCAETKSLSDSSASLRLTFLGDGSSLNNLPSSSFQDSVDMTASLFTDSSSPTMDLMDNQGCGSRENDEMGGNWSPGGSGNRFANDRFNSHSSPAMTPSVATRSRRVDRSEQPSNHSRRWQDAIPVHRQDYGSLFSDSAPDGRHPDVVNGTMRHPSLDDPGGGRRSVPTGGWGDRAERSQQLGPTLSFDKPQPAYGSNLRDKDDFSRDETVRRRTSGYPPPFSSSIHDCRVRAERYPRDVFDPPPPLDENPTADYFPCAGRDRYSRTYTEHDLPPPIDHRRQTPFNDTGFENRSREIRSRQHYSEHSPRSSYLTRGCSPRTPTEHDRYSPQQDQDDYHHWLVDENRRQHPSGETMHRHRARENEYLKSPVSRPHQSHPRSDHLRGGDWSSDRLENDYHRRQRMSSKWENDQSWPSQHNSHNRVSQEGRNRYSLPILEERTEFVRGDSQRDHARPSRPDMGVVGCGIPVNDHCQRANEVPRRLGNAHPSDELCNDHRRSPGAYVEDHDRLHHQHKPEKPYPIAHPSLPVPACGPNDEIFIEVFPGVTERLRRTKETTKAIEGDFFTPATCVACNSDVFCIADVLYYICPKCQCISSLDGELFDGAPVKRRGVGIAFGVETLFKVQSEIVQSQQREHIMRGQSKHR